MASVGPLFAACLLATPLTQVDSKPATPPQMPDIRFDGSLSGEQFFENSDASIAMRVGHNMIDRQVRITCRIFRDPPTRSGLPLEALEPTPYWPTCTAALVNGCFAVAGKSPRTGNTRIELWTVAPPETSVDAASLMRSVTKPARVSCKVDLYDADATTTGVVMRMQAMLTPNDQPTHLLVQFHGTHDLYSLDLENGSIKRVAGPLAKGDGLTIPLLARELGSQVLRHRTEGYLYVFWVWVGHFTPPTKDDAETCIVVLRDADRDSVIESYSTYSLSEYKQAGYLEKNSFQHESRR